MEGHLRIKDLDAGQRPRERLAELGADKLSNAELLAILLRTGTRDASALDVAERLLRRFDHSLESLARARREDFEQTKGIGFDKAVTLRAALQLASNLSRESRKESPVLDSPESIAGLLRDEAVGWNVERLQLLMLNTRRRLIRVETIAEGLLDQLLVHAREVFRPAIAANAHAVVLVHNHPSGDPSPSEADIKVTRDLIRAGQLLKIEVLDHIILGRRSAERPRDYSSLRELGYFYS
jgi:DNA repair protein RadC